MDPLLPAEIEADAHPFVRFLLREHPAVSRVVSGMDEMLTETLRHHDWDFALASYFTRGLAAFHAHEQIVRALPRRPRRILDFAAGFGRATRFLAQDDVTAAEIQKPALDFLRRTLHVKTLLSPSDPAAFRPPHLYDLIVSHSFFSHQPAATFALWLRALANALEEDGTLVFSVHDESLIDPAVRDPGGLTFRAVSETDRLSSEEYGSTWVSQRYVENAIASAFPRASVHRWPRGLGNFQDLYIVTREPIAAATLDQGPFGFFSISRLRSGEELDLVGWAAHWNPAHQVVRVGVSIDGTEVAATSAFFSRDDVPALTGAAHHLHSGWRCRFRIPVTASRNTSILSIHATSDSGAGTLLYIGTISQSLLTSAAAELESAGRLTAVFPDAATADEISAQIAARTVEERGELRPPPQRSKG